MKQPKLVYQAQEYDRGCSIASLAMVLGRKQIEIAADFHTDFSKKGVPIKVIREYLTDEGLIVIEKVGHSSGDRQKHNKRMLMPFADVHIVMALTVVDVPINHILVVDQRGRIYDPGRKRAKPTDYYYVVSNLGIFWD